MGRRSLMKGETRDRWDLERIDSVCEDKGVIVSIRLDSFSVAELNVAAPRDMEIQFPLDIASNAAMITNTFRDRPFESQYIQGEGESVFTYAWFFPTVTEGQPDIKITVIGRSGNFPSEPPTPCSQELVRYRYGDILAISKDARTTSIEVGLTAPHDFKEPQYC
jgi:hypothetical protein